MLRRGSKVGGRSPHRAWSRAAGAAHMEPGGSRRDQCPGVGLLLSLGPALRRELGIRGRHRGGRRSSWPVLSVRIFPLRRKEVLPRG